MTPQKYPQNVHTPKNIIFSENPQKILKFKNLTPKNGPSLRMYENIRVPPWGPDPPPPLKNHKTVGFLSNTGPDPLKNHKATCQHSIVDDH